MKISIIPQGYRKVKTGKVTQGDLTLSLASLAFKPAPKLFIGYPVFAFPCIIRKVEEQVCRTVK